MSTQPGPSGTGSLPPLNSLGLTTDLFFLAEQAEIDDAGDCLIIRTRDNPTHYWGNFLLLRQAPKPGACESWLERFQREIAYSPRIHHRVFAWDEVNGDTAPAQPFLEHGFTLQRTTVLVREGAPVFVPAPVVDGQFLEFGTDLSWQGWEEILHIEHVETYHTDTGSDYLERRRSVYERMVSTGKGAWFAYVVGDRIAAHLGLFGREGLARFQNVYCHPEFRRLGCARALICHAMRESNRRFGFQDFVICADPGYHAIDLYLQMGFEEQEFLVAVEDTPLTR